MAGIYLHIPFCKSKCAYCDFYSVANLNNMEFFVDSICKEIELRKNYLENEKIQTIYFGGGTPSVLNIKQIEILLNELQKKFILSENLEITIEANPDDLDQEKLSDFKNAGINRLSIGVQSFDDADLRYMKRRHTSEQVFKVIDEAKKLNFKNISIDLIYGLPNLTLEKWKQNLEKTFSLNIQHVSAYHLTIEPNTLFNKYNKQGILNLPTEEESLEQFKMLRNETEKNGFLNYEISNFAKDGFISLHNTNYWMDVKYLGLGPSAHSYNLTSRQWNISNLHIYLDSIRQGKVPYEVENLTLKEKFNDYIITSMRTMWGADINKIKKDYGFNNEKYFLKKIEKFKERNLIIKSGEKFYLSEEGIFISDNILQDLLYE